MSFEIFTYEKTSAEIDRVIGSLREKEWNLVNKLMDISGMSDSAKTVMKGKTEEIKNDLKTIEKDINALSDMLLRIRNVRELPEEIKRKLYSVYRVLGVKLAEFASRLPICYEGLLVEISPQVEKGEIETAQALYKKYERLALPKYYVWCPSEGII